MSRLKTCLKTCLGHAQLRFLAWNNWYNTCPYQNNNKNISIHKLKSFYFKCNKIYTCITSLRHLQICNNIYDATCTSLFWCKCMAILKYSIHFDIKNIQIREFASLLVDCCLGSSVASKYLPWFSSTHTKIPSSFLCWSFFAVHTWEQQMNPHTCLLIFTLPRWVDFTLFLVYCCKSAPAFGKMAFWSAPVFMLHTNFLFARFPWNPDFFGSSSPSILMPVKMAQNRWVFSDIS